MAKVKGLSAVVLQLRIERTNLASQLRHVDEALSVLGQLNGRRPYGGARRTLSAAARRKISLAQKARWARQASNSQSGTRPKRTMSAAARKKIAEAQRRRWAKLRQAA